VLNARTTARHCALLSPSFGEGREEAVTAQTLTGFETLLGLLAIATASLEVGCIQIAPNLYASLGVIHIEHPVFCRYEMLAIAMPACICSIAPASAGGLRRRASRTGFSPTFPASPNILAKAPVMCGDLHPHRLKPGAIQSPSDRANPNRVQNPVRVTRDCDARLHLPPTPSQGGGGVVSVGMAVSDSTTNKGACPLAERPQDYNSEWTRLHRRYHNTPPTPSQEGRAERRSAVIGNTAQLSVIASEAIAHITDAPSGGRIFVQSSVSVSVAAGLPSSVSATDRL
jgi:hypothetical protein